MADEIRQQLGFDAGQALDTLKQLDGALQSLERGLNSAAQAAGNFNKAGGSFANVKQGVQAFNQLGQAGQRNAATITNAFNQLISVNGRYSTSLALLSRIAFTQAVVSGFRLTRQAIEDSIQASIDFQKQLAEIKSIDTDKIFGADLGDKLRGISSDFNIALPDVAKGAYEALSAQVLKTGNDFKFMTAAAQFSKGSLTSMEATIKGLAGGLNAYGQSTDNADRLASQFNETIRLGTIRGEELAHNFGTIATLGHQLGASQSELLAAVAALTNAGVPQAQAFTQLRSVLTGLVKPSEQLAKVFRAQGIASAEQLIADRGLGGALQFLRAQTDGTTAGTAELFRNQRALLGVLSLGGQNAKTYADDLKVLDGVMSSLNAQRAQEVMASDAEQLTKKWNQLKVSLIPVGDGFVTVANTGLDAAAVLRDFSVAALDTTGSLLRLKPRVSEFGNAWQNLQALFGKDLTIGESGGKIISEFEIRQRQLDIIAKRRDVDNKAQLAQEAKQQGELNKLRFAALDNFKDRNRELLAEATSAGDALVNVEKRKIAELAKQINQARELLRQSPSQIQGTEQRQERRDFDTRTSGLSDAQKSFALMQRASDLASKASAALATAGRSGNQSAIQQARAMFEAAQATGEEAQSLAQSADDRRGALFAAQKLRDLTSQQVGAERNLAAITAARIPSLEQQRLKQQQTLAVIQAATKTLALNSSLFDKQGNQLSPQQLDAQAKARQQALQSLLQQGVSKDTVVDLQFKTDTAIQRLQTDLQGALSRIDASPFARSLREGQQAINSAAQASATLNTNARSAAGALIAGANRWLDASRASFKTPTPKTAYAGLLKTGYFASGGFARGVDTIPAMLSQGESVINARSTDRFFSQLQAINAGQNPVFRSGGGTVNSNNVGDVHVNIKTSDPSQIDGRKIGRELRREIRRGNIKL